MTAPRAVTSELSRFVSDTSFADLPEPVQKEAVRAFLNWLGCAIGGCREEVTLRGLAATDQRGPATLIGAGRTSDLAGAAFVNCLSSSALAYDDTHLATVTHPTGPVAAPLLALSEMQTISGPDFLAALALGIEIECRLSNAILMPPAKPNVALYITGQTGPVGGAAALGRVMGFDPAQIEGAIGFAATQGAGLRATHGAMSALVVPAIAARAAVLAAQMTKAGMICSPGVLESKHGFLAVHSPDASHDIALAGLGETYEVLANAYKPYPSGIVLHPAIDACREILDKSGSRRITEITIRVHPLTMTLADRLTPETEFQAQVSLQHWAAAVLCRGEFGIDVNRDSWIHDAEIAEFRGRVHGVADPSLARDQASAVARLDDGSEVEAFVEHARGSLARPMSDAELDEKFMRIASPVLGEQRAGRLIAVLRQLPDSANVGRSVFEHI